MVFSVYRLSPISRSGTHEPIVDTIASQLYNGEVIPPFDTHGNLPPGVHPATLVDVEHRFAHNCKRRLLFAGLARVVAILREANCPEIYLDGSFITSKEEPGDFDLCFEPTGVTPTDDLFVLLNNKTDRKGEYLGDIFVRMPQPPYFFDHVQIWQVDGRNDDAAKGILRIRLRSGINAEE